MEEDIRKETLKRVAHELAVAGQKQNAPLSEEQIIALLEQRLMTVIPEVTEVRPQVLECDVVRFQNNKEKWVALVGLLDGYPYEIFTGLQDDEEGIMLPKTVTHGKIIKQVNPDGSKRYDFQFENKRGYKTTVLPYAARTCDQACGLALVEGREYQHLEDGCRACPEEVYPR